MYFNGIFYYCDEYLSLNMNWCKNFEYFSFLGIVNIYLGYFL